MSGVSRFRIVAMPCTGRKNCGAPVAVCVILRCQNSGAPFTRHKNILPNIEALQRTLPLIRRQYRYGKIVLFSVCEKHNASGAQWSRPSRHSPSCADGFQSNGSRSDTKFLFLRPEERILSIQKILHEDRIRSTCLFKHGCGFEYGPPSQSRGTSGHFNLASSFGLAQDWR